MIDSAFSLPSIGIDYCHFQYDPYQHELRVPDPRFEIPCRAAMIIEAANHFLNNDQEIQKEVLEEFTNEVLAWLQFKSI